MVAVPGRVTEGRGVMACAGAGVCHTAAMDSCGRGLGAFQNSHSDRWADKEGPLVLYCAASVFE